MSIRPVIALIILLSGGLLSIAIAGCSGRLVWLPETVEPPLAGPFRPRPRPDPPAPPQPTPPPTPVPEPIDERERVLFGRVRAWAEQAAEHRADERLRRLQPTDEEIEAAIAGRSMVDLSGGVGAWFAVVLVGVVKKVLGLILLGLVTSVLLSLLATYWYWPAGFALVTAGLSALAARLFGRKS